MKKIILLGYALFLFSLCAQSQTVFSVKPGLNLNAATISFGSGKVHPVFGLTFANFNSKYESKDVGFSNESQTKLHLYMPGFGVKVETGKSEILQNFVIFRIFKPLIFGKHLEDGMEDPTYGDDINDIKIWGAELSYSVEYFLAEQFSPGLPMYIVSPP